MVLSSLTQFCSVMTSNFFQTRKFFDEIEEKYFKSVIFHEIVPFIVNVQFLFFCIFILENIPYRNILCCFDVNIEFLPFEVGVLL